MTAVSSEPDRTLRLTPEGSRVAAAARWLASHSLPGVLSLAALIAAWQIAVTILDPSPVILPAPADVWRSLVAAWEEGAVANAVGESMAPLAIGMALSMVGVPAGLAIGMSRRTDLITSPYLWGFFALPNISFAPLVILWLGFGTSTRICMVFLAAAVPLTLNCKDGVQSVDESLIRVAKSFDANTLALFRKVILPGSMPFVATGLRNSVSRGFVGLLSVELLVGTGGIGGEVMRSLDTYDTARMFVFVFLLIVIALFLVSLSRRVEAYANRWREEVVL